MSSCALERPAWPLQGVAGGVPWPTEVAFKPTDETRAAPWETNLPGKRSWGWDLSVRVTEGSNGNIGFANHSALCPPLSGVPSGEGTSWWPLGLSLCQPVAVAAQDRAHENAASPGRFSSLFGFQYHDLSAKLAFFSKVSL